MSSLKTEHYGLHKWEPGDDFVRVEFNENFARIDGALGEKPEVVIGSYTGNTSSNTGSQEIVLGFRPSAVLIADKEGFLSMNSQIRGGLYTEANQGLNFYFRFTDTGFVLTNGNYALTQTSGCSPYVFLAVR